LLPGINFTKAAGQNNKKAGLTEHRAPPHNNIISYGAELGIKSNIRKLHPGN